MNVSQEVLEVLDAAALDGSALRLVGQIERSLYVRANKVIEAAGGKWSRGAKAHIFDGEAADAIEPILLTGEYTTAKQDFGQFDSPPAVVARLMELAEIVPGMSVLEPSAGIGNIVVGAETAGGLVSAYEVDAKRLHAAKDRCVLRGGIHLTSFLMIRAEPDFDRVVMNPPFAKQADIAHVSHAARFLKPDGRLVAVMSSGIQFRDNKLTRDFRDFLSERSAEIEALPAGTFKDSGTGVNAVIVSFNGEGAE